MVVVVSALAIFPVVDNLLEQFFCFPVLIALRQIRKPLFNTIASLHNKFLRLAGHSVPIREFFLYQFPGKLLFGLVLKFWCDVHGFLSIPPSMCQDSL